MEKLLFYYDAYGMEIIGGIGIVLIICSSIQIHKTSVLNRRMNLVATEIKRYLNLVLEEEEASEQIEKERLLTEKQQRKRQQEEDQNRLISAVLEEIFP